MSFLTKASIFLSRKFVAAYPCGFQKRLRRRERPDKGSSPPSHEKNHVPPFGFFPRPGRRPDRDLLPVDGENASPGRTPASAAPLSGSTSSTTPAAPVGATVSPSPDPLGRGAGPASAPPVPGDDGQGDFWRLPLRRISSSAFLPGGVLATSSCSARTPRTSLPLRVRRTSPRRTPALAAGGGNDLIHQRSGHSVETEGFSQFGSQGLDGNPQPSAGYLACFDQLIGDQLGQVDGNGKTDPLAGGNDGRIDSHHLAVHIEQRPPGISGIDGGIGLNEIFVILNTDIGAAGRGNDPDRQGPVEAEGIADGQGPLSNLQGVRIAQDRGGQLPSGVDLEDRHIGAGIDPHHLAVVDPVDGELDLDLLRPLDHMFIGEDIAVLADDEAGAEALLLAAPLRLVPEQVAEKVIEQGPMLRMDWTRSARMFTTTGVTLRDFDEGLLGGEDLLGGLLYGRIDLFLLDPGCDFDLLFLAATGQEKAGSDYQKNGRIGRETGLMMSPFFRPQGQRRLAKKFNDVNYRSSIGG